MNVERWQKKKSHTGGVSSAEVEVVLLNEDNAEEVAQWCGAQVVEEYDALHPQERQKGLNLTTSTGVSRASLGMYVIQYSPGKFVVSHVRPFEELYKRIDAPTPPPQSSGEAAYSRGFADPFGPGRRL